jgi:FtsH-binding integral membrane protein
LSGPSTSSITAAGASTNFSDCKFFLVMAVIGVIVYSVAYP